MLSNIVFFHDIFFNNFSIFINLEIFPGPSTSCPRLLVTLVPFYKRFILTYILHACMYFHGHAAEEILFHSFAIIIIRNKRAINYRACFLTRTACNIRTFRKYGNVFHLPKAIIKLGFTSSARSAILAAIPFSTLVV